MPQLTCLETWSLMCSQLNHKVSWRPLNSTTVFLTKTDPLTPNNQVAMNVTAHAPGGGIANTGYWGVPLNGGWIYHFSVYLKGNEYAVNSTVCTSSFLFATHDSLHSITMKFVSLMSKIAELPCCQQNVLPSNNEDQACISKQWTVQTQPLM